MVFIAYSKKMNNIQTIALDRMLAVSKDEKGTYVENTFFDPSIYLDEMVGVTRDIHSQKEVVTLWVDADQAPYVLTKPMHSSQRLVQENEDGSIILSLEVILNLDWNDYSWLGCHMEVKTPRLLRYRIAQAILLAATRYQM